MQPDLVIIAVARTSTVGGTRDELVRRLVRAQDLHLIDRSPGDVTDSAAILQAWLRE